MKSREEDLDKLSTKRFHSKQEGTKEHMEALLVSVFEQSKDPVLERLRDRLIGILQFMEEHGESDEKWIDYVATIKKIEDYTNSEVFKTNIATKIAKAVNDEEASRFYFKKGGE